MTNEHPDREQLREQLRNTLNEMVAYVNSGQSPGIVFMTFGAGGQTLLSGDPGALVLALEVAKANLVAFAMQQTAERASAAEREFYHLKPAGNA